MPEDEAESFLLDQKSSPQELDAKSFLEVDEAESFLLSETKKPSILKRAGQVASKIFLEPSPILGEETLSVARKAGEAVSRLTPDITIPKEATKALAPSVIPILQPLKPLLDVVTPDIPLKELSRIGTESMFPVTPFEQATTLLPFFGKTVSRFVAKSPFRFLIKGDVVGLAKESKLSKEAASEILGMAQKQLAYNPLPQAQAGEISRFVPDLSLDRIGKAVENAESLGLDARTGLSTREIEVFKRFESQIRASGDFKIPIESVLTKAEKVELGLEKLTPQIKEEFGFKIQRPAPAHWNFEKRSMAESGLGVVEEKPGKFKTFINGNDLDALDETTLRQEAAKMGKDDLTRLERQLGRNEALNPETLALNVEPKLGPIGKSEKAFTRFVNKYSSALNSYIDKGLGDARPLVRGISKGVRSLFGEAGSTPERLDMVRALTGKQQEGTKLAQDAQQYVYDLVGRNENSLKRIHSVLDPEMAKIKVNEKDLTLNETKATEFLRKLSNVIHNKNFANGFISKETWLKNLNGKYINRGYDPFEFGIGGEVAEDLKFIGQKKGIDLKLYLKRGGLTDWKIDNAVRDPAYLLSKRLSQTFRNEAMLEHFKWVNTQSNLVSDVSKPNFIKVADSPKWGPLKDKYVRKDAMEDVVGYFFGNEQLQKIYDFLNAYNRNPARQQIKKNLTVRNPTIHLGNNISNLLFSFLNGDNPISNAKNLLWASKKLKSLDPLVSEARKLGMFGNDYSSTDLIEQAAAIRSMAARNVIKIGEEGEGLAKGLLDKIPGGKKLRQLDEWLLVSYSKADDLAKLSSLKTKVDKGLPIKQAVREVMDGFQNYRSVGLAYDVLSKTPWIGNPFIKFPADLMRILGNSAKQHPIRLIGALTALKVMADGWSYLSGETDEDRAIRESRTGFAHVPLLGIPLEWQTPWGAVNISRYLGISGAYNKLTGPSKLADIQRFLPFQLPIPEKWDRESFAKAWAQSSQDVLLGPLFQMAVLNRDFRGKPITDPEETAFKPSTLTPSQQAINMGQFLIRAYNLPTLNDIASLIKVYNTGKDLFDRDQTLSQAVVRIFGLKVAQFGPEEVKKERAKRIEFLGSDIKRYQKIIRDIALKKLDADDKAHRIEYFKGLIQDAYEDIQNLRLK